VSYPTFPDVAILNHSKLFLLSIEDVQWSMLCNAIYDQVLYGSHTLRRFADATRNAFLEIGFARHIHKVNYMVIDEPLAILAALQWLYNSQAFSMFKILRDNIHKHETRKNEFEAYLAFYMRTVFEEPRNSIQYLPFGRILPRGVKQTLLGNTKTSSL